MFGERDVQLNPGLRMPRRHPKFSGYGELYSAASIVSNVLTLDCNVSQHFTVTLNANITTLTIKNAQVLSPAVNGFGLITGIEVIFTANGSSFSITAANVKWAANTAPTLTSTNGKADIIIFQCINGTSTIYGIVAGQNF